MKKIIISSSVILVILGLVVFYFLSGRQIINQATIKKLSEEESQIIMREYKKEIEEKNREYDQ